MSQILLAPGNPFPPEKGAKQRGIQFCRSPSSSVALDRLRLSSKFPQYPFNEAFRVRRRYVKGRAQHYQTDTDKSQCEHVLDITGRALFRLSRGGR